MRLSVFAALALTLLPITASAQSLASPLGNTNTFSITVTPQYPAPLGQAVISLLSSELDLTNATVSVSVNGKQIYKGSARPIIVPLGKGGSVSTVLVTVSYGDGQYQESVTIQPQEVSLIAEPVATAPALYLGKPFVPLEGTTRVVAVASLRDAGGKTIDPATLSYAWTVDGAQIAGSSGIGKSAVMVASPLRYRNRQVSVAIQSQDGALVGGAALSLSSEEPRIRIYENNPLLGIRYDHALSNTYAIAESEASLYAAPYSLPKLGRAPVLRWFLNGSPAQTGSSLTLRPAGVGRGTAELSVTASAGTEAIATAALTISFGSQAGSNFFGL